MLVTLAVFAIVAKASTGQIRRQETQGEHLAVARESLVLMRDRKRAVFVTATGNVNQSPSDSHSLPTLDAGRLAKVVRRHGSREENLTEPRINASVDSIRRQVAVMAATSDSSLASRDILTAVGGDPSSRSSSTARPKTTDDASVNRDPILDWSETGLDDPMAELRRFGVRSERHAGIRYPEAIPSNTPTTIAMARTLAASNQTPNLQSASGAAHAKTIAAAPTAMSSSHLPKIRNKQAAGSGPLSGAVAMVAQASAMQQPVTTAAPALATETPGTTTNVAAPGAATVPPPDEPESNGMFTISGLLEFVFIVVACILCGIPVGIFVIRWSTADNPSEHLGRRFSSSRGSDDASQASLDSFSRYHESAEAFLKEVGLFKRLPPESLRALAKNLTAKTFESGEAVVKQGEEGDEFFMIWKGIANVKVDGQTVATLKPGDHFGENSLLCSELRKATIVGHTTIAVFSITKEQFLKLGLNEKLEFPKRMAVARGADHDVRIEPPTPKTQEEEQLIIDALRVNKSLAFLRLTDNSMKEMAAVAWKVDVATGTEIITQGDMQAAYFYVVQEGSFLVSVVEESIWQHHHSKSERVRNSLHMRLIQAHGSHSIAKGGSFGALALLYNAPRSATVTANEPSAVWVIARPHFKDVLMKAAEEHISAYVQHLSNVKATADLPEQQKVKIAKALVEMTLQKGDVPCKQGEKGDTFYILIEGTVDIIKDGVSLFQNGDYPTGRPGKPVQFGQSALESEGNCRAATVEILSDKARCLVLDKTSYDMLLGKYSPQRNTRKFGEIHLKDLNRLGVLGCGGFGRVELVEHTKSGHMYALKIQSKGFIVEQQIERFVMNEKDLQLMCDSPFITKLLETFNEGDSLYMVLELCLGGEVWDVYNKKGMWGQVPNARYYVAGVVFAFEHMHSKKILFRDLKPENMLLTEKGQVKLTDLGLAKCVVGKTFSVCGTPEYLAPEVIASKGTTSAADWWALGIVIFELLASYPAFNDSSPMAIFKSIGEGIEKVHFPRVCKGDVKGLIQGLCQHEPHERLPMKQGGTDNIKYHVWYRGFDWDAMLNLTMEPPYVPRVKNKKDMSNFADKSGTSPSVSGKEVPYRDPGTGWDKDFATST